MSRNLLSLENIIKGQITCKKVAVDYAAFIFVLYTLVYKQHFYKQHQAEIGKNQANAKQHPEAERLTFENFSHSSSTLSSKKNRTYSKKSAKK